jgi:hypothetical protein
MKREFNIPLLPTEELGFNTNKGEHEVDVSSIGPWPYFLSMLGFNIQIYFNFLIFAHI